MKRHILLLKKDNSVSAGIQQVLINSNFFSQYASYSPTFSPLHSVINGEQYERHLHN